MPDSYATVGATGDASRGIPRCAAIPGGSGGTGGTEAAALAAAGIGGAAAQRESPGRDPPRAIGGAADAHCPAIKWSSCGKTRGWRVVVLGSWEVVLMLVQFKIVKTVAIVMQSFMDCRDSDHLLREILQWRQVSLSLAEPAEAVLKLLLDAGLFWPRAASSLGPAQVGNLELNRWMVKLWRLKVLKGGFV